MRPVRSFCKAPRAKLRLFHISELCGRRPIASAGGNWILSILGSWKGLIARTIEVIPVNLITGFLGSGKTTLLKGLLNSPELRSAAVLVNELGEVGLDHHLLRRVDETTVLLQSGCLCCTIRSDLRDSIHDLFDRRERGTVPPFDRLIIETTGLADPAPIVATLINDSVIRHHFRLGNIVTVVDAKNGRANLSAFAESRKQVAVADRIVISKTDISAAGETARLRAELETLNGTAAQLDPHQEHVSPSDLIARDVHDPTGKASEVHRWFAAAHEQKSEDGHGSGPSRHESEIMASCISVEEPLDWPAFAVWLTMLLNRHGQDILRVKGMLNIAGVPTPVIIHGVQHTIHPPSHLEAWPEGAARTCIIFITRGISRQRLQESLDVFLRLATRNSS
jgi:G3E family GTPase